MTDKDTQNNLRPVGMKFKIDTPYGCTEYVVVAHALAEVRGRCVMIEEVKAISSSFVDPLSNLSGMGGQTITFDQLNRWQK